MLQSINQSNFISPESLNTGREQRKANWSPMSAAPEAKLLNNTGEYLSLSQKTKKKKKTHLRILHNRTKLNEKKTNHLHQKHINCTKSRVLDNTGNNLGNKRMLTIKAKLHAYNLRTQKKKWEEKILSRKTISQTSRWLYHHPVTKMFMLKYKKYDVFFYVNSSSLLQ